MYVDKRSEVLGATGEAMAWLVKVVQKFTICKQYFVLFDFKSTDLLYVYCFITPFLYYANRQTTEHEWLSDYEHDWLTDYEKFTEVCLRIYMYLLYMHGYIILCTIML